MKKKGRISGTIGWILSVALVGGVVVYSTMFDQYATGKAGKNLGSSTGNIVSALTKGEGLDETKKLLAEANDSMFAKPAADATYKSFSFDYSMSSYISAGENVAFVESDGSVYSDAAYTYMHVVASTHENRTTTVAEYEFVYDKEANKLWEHGSIVAGATETWTVVSMEDAEVVATLIPVSVLGMFYEIGNAATGAKWDLMSGGFQFTIPAEEGVSQAAYFTLGYNPTFNYSGEATQEAEGVKTLMRTTMSMNYTNLNRTEVNLPEALKTAMSEEA